MSHFGSRYLEDCTAPVGRKQRSPTDVATGKEHPPHAQKYKSQSDLWTPKKPRRVFESRSPSARRQNQRSRNSRLDYLGTLDSIISMDQNHQNPKPTSGHFQLHESRTSNKRITNIKQTKPLAHPATKHKDRFQ